MQSHARRLRVAQYYPWAYLTSGIERVLLQIVSRSRHEHTIFTNHFDPENTYPELAKAHVVELERVPVKRNLSQVARAAATLIGQRLPLEGYDALMVHCDGLGDLVLARNHRLPTLCYCHTPLRPVFDPAYRARARANFTGARALLFNLFSLGFRRVDRLLWRRYQRVLFNSSETRRRAEQGGLLPNGRTASEVLHPGVDFDRIEPTWRYESYFLVPGRIMWTKNIELAIEAFRLLRVSHAETEGFRLVIAGRVDEKSRVYLERLRHLAGATPGVEFVVSPSEDRLHELYQDCAAVLFPSFNEDWGLVPLEANAHGKPVIATNAGGPAESQIDGVSGFLSPPVAGHFASHMLNLVRNPSLLSAIGRTARRHAEQYDAARFVERLDEAIEGVVKEAVGLVPGVALAPEPAVWKPQTQTER